MVDKNLGQHVVNELIKHGTIRSHCKGVTVFEDNVYEVIKNAVVDWEDEWGEEYEKLD